MELNDEMKATIEKQLPAEMGKMLKGLLNDAEKLKTKYENSLSELKLYKEKDNVSTKRIYELESVVSKCSDLTKKEEELKERERNIKIEILEIELAEANKRSSTAIWELSLLFKNRTYREDVITSDSSPQKHDEFGGQLGFISSKNITKDEE